MKPEDVDLLVALCRARAGLRVDPAKPYLIDSRLSPLARRHGLGAVGELFTRLRETRDEALIWGIVEAMTQGETDFFRDREPFEQLREEILPSLSRAKRGEPLRIWSAACSTGQEVYSLAMILAEMQDDGVAVNAQLFASDLSEQRLEKARSGLFTAFEVQRGLPVRRLVNHFEKVGELWAISPRLRGSVRWRRANLIADLSGLGQFDVILCRNVMNGMQPDMTGRLVERLSGALAPAGCLLLGKDETVPLGLDLRPLSGRPGLYARDPALLAA